MQEVQIVRYYIKSESMGYYCIDKRMFFKQPGIPDASAFHSNDYGFICGEFYGLQKNFPDIEILQISFPVNVQKVK